MDVDNAIQNATTKLVSEANEGAEAVGTVKDMLPHQSAKAFFGVDDKSLTNETTERLNEIWEWASKQADGEDDLDVLRVLRDIRFKLGSTPADKSFLDNFYQYMKISKDVKGLTAKLKAMEQ